MHKIRQRRARTIANVTRFVTALSTATALALLAAPGALASYGRGLWGEVDDKVTTDFGLLLIAFFPLLVLVLSLIQWRLDKRKQAHKAAEKAHAGDAYWHGGW